MPERLEKLWVEKYRPKTVEDYVFQHKSDFKLITKMILEGSIPNLLLSGVQGSGKSSLCEVLFNELKIIPADILKINASEMGMDDIRDRILGFVSTLPIGNFKVVQLEEADYIPIKSQGALRNPMEQYSNDARFVLTCNYPNRIMPAIHSRCQHFQFSAFPRNKVYERIEYILTSEQVKFTEDLVDTFISLAYPDIRKIIHLVEQHTNNGVLTAPGSSEESKDYKINLLGMLETDNWVDIRRKVCPMVADNEWDDVYRFLYENLHKSGKFSNDRTWEEGILIITDYLYRNSIVADPEINFAACLIKLSKV